LKAVAIAILGLSISAAVLAAGSDESKTRGPEGFGNIPYGSSSTEAVKLNHGNGVITSKNDVPALTYRTKIQGLTFDVTQNYDKNRKAVDALALSTSLEPARSCVARFNHVLASLQTTYGQSGSSPLQSRTVQGDIKYTVLFHFSGNNGIEAELTTGDPSISAPRTSPTVRRGSSASPCVIRLHYLPPGWVGRF
jgi:hypothetical protein